MANIVAHPPDGLNGLANKRLTPWLAKQLGASIQGCAYRGTTTCLRCPWAKRVPVECDYLCTDCGWRSLCPCGHDGQTLRMDTWLGLAIGAAEGIHKREGIE